MGSGGSGHYCPICGSELVVVRPLGEDGSKKAREMAKHEGFCVFLGCLRVDLHDKVVDGVDYRGKVFIEAVFHRR